VRERAERGKWKGRENKRQGKVTRPSSGGGVIDVPLSNSVSGYSE